MTDHPKYLAMIPHIRRKSLSTAPAYANGFSVGYGSDFGWL